MGSMGGGILFIVAKKLSLPAGERESSELMVSGGGENVGWASPEEIRDWNEYFFFSRGLEFGYRSDKLFPKSNADMIQYQADHA